MESQEPVQLADDQVQAGGELGQGDEPEREPALGVSEGEHLDQGALYHVGTDVQSKV